MNDTVPRRLSGSFSYIEKYKVENRVGVTIK